MGFYDELVKETLKLESEAVLDVLDHLDLQVMDRIIQLISKSDGKIVLAGSGTSGAAARKISHTLNCIERPAVFLEPSEALHGGLGLIQQKDIVFLLSKGGETEEINMYIPACKAKKATIIAVTENTDSYLAKNADIVLLIKVKREADPFNVFATSSIIATLAVFDAICIGVATETNYSKERFSVIHPGGAVGKKLKDEFR